MKPIHLTHDSGAPLITALCGIRVPRYEAMGVLYYEKYGLKSSLIKYQHCDGCIMMYFYEKGLAPGGGSVI